MPKITPFLWFDDAAEEAARFYTSIIKNSRIKSIARYGESGAQVARRPKGSVMTVDFELDGQPFTALNGGPMFKFTPAVSFVIHCKTQEEVDELWEKLSEGGRRDQCGWLTDKYGLSWQIVPTVLLELMEDKDPKKVERVMAAMLKMGKLDIDALKKAYEG